MKQRRLEMLLQRVPPIPDPDPRFEQYSTPAPLAAAVLFQAAMNGDIIGRAVADLGCGTGVLAIGAQLIGAERVCGVDRSPAAITVARATAKRMHADATMTFILADVAKLCVVAGERARQALDARPDSCPLVRVETVIQNPPFGAQNRHADRSFITAALALAPVVYHFCLPESLAFTTAFSRDHGASITAQEKYIFSIPHTFDFHTLPTKEIEVLVLRLERDEHDI